MIGRTVAMALAAAACASAGAQAATPMASAGGAHSVALRADGTVRAWGSDRAGELGIGTSIVVLTPRAIAGLPPLRTGLESLSAGWWHALAIAADGSVRAMGWNARARLMCGLVGAAAVECSLRS